MVPLPRKGQVGLEDARWTPRDRWFVNISWRLTNYPRAAQRLGGSHLPKVIQGSKMEELAPIGTLIGGRRCLSGIFYVEGATALFLGHRYGCSGGRQGFLFADSAS